MPNKEPYPRKMPYEMHPGKHSEVNPGNFKGSEIKKYSAFMYNPTLTDMSGDDQVTRKDFLIKVGAKGFEKNMDKKAKLHHGGPQDHHALDHKNADGTHKAKELPMRKSSNVINLGGGRAIGNLDLRSQKPSDQKDIIVSKPKKYKY